MHADVEIPRTSRTEWLLFASVLLVALAVRLVLFVGIVRLDMFRYLEMSNHVLSGGSLFDKTVYYYSGRLALVGPLFLFNRIFGFSELASVLWPLLCSLASVTGVFFIGRELYGSRVGLLAALGMALVPLQVELGTQVLPDPIEGGFLVLAVLFGIFAITRDRGWRWWAIGSGAALALAYFTRVNAIIFLPGILVIGAILKPSRWRRSLWALAGVVGVLAGAAVIFWALSGDPLVDWHRTAQFYSSYAGTGFVFREQRFWRQMLNVRQYATAWLLPVLALGTSWALARRQRASWLMLVWAYAFWIYLDVISPLHGLDTSYRYVEPLVPPVLLLFSAGVIGVSDRSRGVRGVWTGRFVVVSACVLLSVLPATRHAEAAAEASPGRARPMTNGGGWRRRCFASPLAGASVKARRCDKALGLILVANRW